MDEFSEIFRTAFDPPSRSFFRSYGDFFQKYMTEMFGSADKADLQVLSLPLPYFSDVSINMF